MKNILRTLSPLLVVFAVLLSSSFIDAAWVAPGGSPSASNNAPAPINVSSQNQIKSGAITAYDLNAGRFVWAGSQMRSNRYCDTSGRNCFSGNDIRNMQNQINNLRTSRGITECRVCTNKNQGARGYKPPFFANTRCTDWVGAGDRDVTVRVVDHGSTGREEAIGLECR